MEEMIDDTISGLDDEDLEEEAEDEVNQVLNEVTSGLLLQGGRVGSDIKVRAQALAAWLKQRALRIPTEWILTGCRGFHASAISSL
jgi:hypothetical protein